MRLFLSAGLCVTSVVAFGGTKASDVVADCEPDSPCLFDDVKVSSVNRTIHKELHAVTKMALKNLEARLKEDDAHEEWSEIHTAIYHQGLDGTEDFSEMISVVRPFGDEHSLEPHIDYYPKGAGRRLLQDSSGGDATLYGGGGFGTPSCSSVPWGGPGLYCIQGDIWACNSKTSYAYMSDSCQYGCTVAPPGQQDYCNSYRPSPTPYPTYYVPPTPYPTYYVPPTPYPTSRPTPYPTYYVPPTRNCCGDQDCYSDEVCDDRGSNNNNYFNQATAYGGGGFCSDICIPRPYCLADNECPDGYHCVGVPPSAESNTPWNPSKPPLLQCEYYTNVKVCPTGSKWKGEGPYCLGGSYLYYCNAPGVTTSSIYDTCEKGNGCSSTYEGEYCVVSPDPICYRDEDCDNDEICGPPTNNNPYRYCEVQRVCTVNSDCPYDYACEGTTIQGRRRQLLQEENVMTFSSSTTTNSISLKGGAGSPYNNDVALYGGGGFNMAGCVPMSSVMVCPVGSYWFGPHPYCMGGDYYYCERPGEQTTQLWKACGDAGCTIDPNNYQCASEKQPPQCTYDYDCPYPDTCSSSRQCVHQPRPDSEMYFYGPYEDYAVKGSNDRIIDYPAVRNGSECADMCLNENAFYCASYEYNPAGRRCVLSKSVYPTIEAAGWTLYIRR